MTGILCKECLEVESYTYMVNPSLELKDKNLAMAQKSLERLCKGEPLQYILGHAEFCGMRFNVSPAVLIPRPETEYICRKVIEQAMMYYRRRLAFGQAAKPVRILDLCTGSGCLAWSLAVNVPGSQVVGIDISADALRVARTQPVEIEKGREPRFLQADIFDELAMEQILKFDPLFDIIVSNPPYVMERERALMKRNVLDFEPDIALFVPDDDAMRFNEKIAEICVKHLNTEEAAGFVEINEALGAQTAEVFESAGFRNVEIIQDLAHKDRLVKFVK